MTMQSPVVALLWENWRLTRLEAAQRVAQGVVLPAALLAVVAALGPIDDGAVRLALGILAMSNMVVWLSVAKLNGGRFMDGYRPGYPFSFLYTRPVRTAVLVGVPMAYLTASAVAVYLVCALVLRATFGHPFPLLPLAAWIAAYHMVQWALQWATSSKAVQFVGSLVGGLAFAAPGFFRTQEWPARLDVPVGDYVLLAAAGAAAFGLAVAGVARQRRGDARGASRTTITLGGCSEWLAGRVRIACPTASSARAQIWFNLKSSGLPLLAIGFGLAIVIPLALLVTTRLDVALSTSMREPATRVVPVVLAMFAVPTLLLLGGNAFGIRTKQGRAYASAFDATQACSTARMAALRLVVRTACLSIALVAVVASIWTSASVVPFDVLGDNDTFIEKSSSPASGLMRTIEAAVTAMSASEQLALAVVAAVVIGVMVAVRAAFAALRACYPRPMKLATAVLLFHGVVLLVLAQLEQNGIVSSSLLYTVQDVVGWMAKTASVLATAYLSWVVLAERLLTPRQACGVMLVSAAFGAAFMMVFTAAGAPLRTMAITDAAQLLLWPMLLPLMASALATWSLSRVRHT